MVEVTFLWFRILLMLTASTLVSEVKFQKITSGSLFWRNCLNRLVHPKLGNIQNDSNQLIFRGIFNIYFCIHHFLLQRVKISYRQPILAIYNVPLFLLQSITKTCLYNFDPLKPHFYIVKLGFTGVYIIFLISAQNIDCGRF